VAFVGWLFQLGRSPLLAEYRPLKVLGQMFTGAVGGGMALTSLMSSTLARNSPDCNLSCESEVLKRRMKS